MPLMIGRANCHTVRRIISAPSSRSSILPSILAGRVITTTIALFIPSSLLLLLLFVVLFQSNNFLYFVKADSNFIEAPAPAAAAASFISPFHRAFGSSFKSSTAAATFASSTYTRTTPPTTLGTASRRGVGVQKQYYLLPMNSFSDEENDKFNNDPGENCGKDAMSSLQFGEETEEPLRSSSDELKRTTTSHAEEEENTTITAVSEDSSVDNKPKRGRPGIVVFSGGTAFNAAAAEMASRNVGNNNNNSNGRGESGGVMPESNLWRLDSWESSMEIMTLPLNDIHNNAQEGDAKANAAATTTAGGESNNYIASNHNTNSMAGGTKVWHVLPVTDDGGSTAEIVRVLGGPAVGDIRSRLLRLAPGTTAEARAVRRLLGHRLFGGGADDLTPEMVGRMAREEWLDLLDGGHESFKESFGLDEDDCDSDGNNDQNANSHEHPLWKGVSAPYRSIIRAFLVHFHTQVLQTHNGLRHSAAHPPFDFTGGSVGNFFFAGARTFFGSLPAAIFLFSKVAGIPSGSRVIPAVLTEERLVLGAVLKDGTRIRGQYAISHPHPKLPPRTQKQQSKSISPTKSKLKNSPPLSPTRNGKDNEHTSSQRERSGSTSSGRHRAVVKSAIDSQEAISSLHLSPMSRVTYLLHDPTWRKRPKTISTNLREKKQANSAETPPLPQCTTSNPTRTTPTISAKTGTTKPSLEWSDRHEIHPEPNPLVIDAISNANCIVYGCGSLFTSVLPSLVLEGIGEAIAQSDNSIPRVLILNGWHDRETSWAEPSGDAEGNLKVQRMDATMYVRAVVDALDQGCIRSGLFTESDFEVHGKGDDMDNADRGESVFGSHQDGSYDENNGDIGLIAIPSVTDYITHILYPIGTEIEIDEQSLHHLCHSRQRMREKQLNQQVGGQKQPQEMLPSPEQGIPLKPATVAPNSQTSSVIKVDGITVMGITSMPANKCADGKRSGGRSHLRVFDPRALVDVLLDLANRGNGLG